MIGNSPLHASQSLLDGQVCTPRQHIIMGVMIYVQHLPSEEAVNNESQTTTLAHARIFFFACLQIDYIQYGRKRTVIRSVDFCSVSVPEWQPPEKPTQKKNQAYEKQATNRVVSDRLVVH